MVKELDMVAAEKKKTPGPKAARKVPTREAEIFNMMGCFADDVKPRR